MYGRGHKWRQRRRNERRALGADAKLRPQDRLRGGGSEADDDARLDDVDFRLQPGAAGVDLGRVRLFVNAPLAARLPLEVLHDVGDVDLGPVDAGLIECFVEKIARRSDEWPSLQVFLISGLLA